MSRCYVEHSALQGAFRHGDCCVDDIGNVDEVAYL